MVCCFFGHRKVEEPERVKERVYSLVEELILRKQVDCFLFGSKSDFDGLCLSVVTDLKKKYSHIRRVYVRAEFPYIDDRYTAYLLTSYDETYYPEKILNAGKAAYVERNREIIEKADFCVVYYNEDYLPPRRKNSRRDLFDYQPKSGTKLAYDYAVKKGKRIFNVFSEELRNS